MRSSAFRPKDSLLSGPAGGVVGASSAGRSAGFDRVLAFDMGGTSTDVARFDGDYDYVFEHQVGGVAIVAPALAIETVAAGGGSLCWIDDGQLRVGPESAGADPGPACYGAGGPLALTDVNLLLGRIDPERFEIPISTEAASEAAHRQLEQVSGLELDEMLSGFLAIANLRMGDAIRRISIQQGYDPRSYALVCFGGAGPQHACAVASEIGASTVVVPPDASLLSAFGLGRAVIERFAHRQILRALDELPAAELDRLFESVAAEAMSELEAEGIDPAACDERRRIARLRFVGQSSAIDLEYRSPEKLAPDFSERYQQLFGARPRDRAVELESIRVICGLRSQRDRRAASEESPAEAPAPTPPVASIERQVFFSGGRQESPEYRRSQLDGEASYDGPALISEQHSITVVEPGWRCRLHPCGALLLERRRA